MIVIPNVLRFVAPVITCEKILGINAPKAREKNKFCSSRHIENLEFLNFWFGINGGLV